MSTDTPLVSIIIPTFNRALLIGETLDSVLAQTYKNWECIVVDDGSNDKTEELLAEYMEKHSGFQYYHRPKDRLSGGNAARNYGFEVSKGEFINFLDSDDLFHPAALKIKINLALKNSCDVVISKHANSLDNLLSQEMLLSGEIIRNTIFDVAFILSRNNIITSDPLIHRSLIENVRFDEELKRFQDHEFFIRLFRQKASVCLLDLKLYFHRPNAQSISSQTKAGNKIMIDTQVAIHEKMNRYYAHEPLVLNEYKRKAQKMYRDLVKNKYFNRVFENYRFFSKAYNLSILNFTMYFIINSFTGRGYDKMKK